MRKDGYHTWKMDDTRERNALLTIPPMRQATKHDHPILLNYLPIATKREREVRILCFFIIRIRKRENPSNCAKARTPNNAPNVDQQLYIKAFR